MKWRAQTKPPSVDKVLKQGENKFPIWGKCGTGYEKNGDGVATEEMSDGRSIEKDGRHSETPVLEEVDIRGWLGRVLSPKVECTVFGLPTITGICQTI